MRNKKVLYRYYSLFMLLFAICFFPFMATAAPTEYQPADIHAFQQEFSSLKQFIRSEQGHYYIMIDGALSLLSLQEKLKLNMHQDEVQLNTISDILKKIQDIAKKTDFYATLEKQHTELLNRIASSRILIFEIQSTVDATIAQSKPFNPFNLNIKKTPIWQDMGLLDLSGITFNSTTAYQRSGLNILLNDRLILGLLITLISAVFMSFFLFKGLSILVKKKSRVGRHFYAALRKERLSICLLFLLIMINLYLYFLFYSIVPKPTILLAANAFLVYILLLTGIRIDSALNSKIRFFPNAIMKYSGFLAVALLIYNYYLLKVSYDLEYYPVELVNYPIITYAAATILLILFFLQRNRSKYTEKVIAIPFLKRSLLFISAALFCYLIVILSDGQNIPLNWVSFWSTAFIILYNLSLLWINWLVFNMKYFTKSKSKRVTIIAKIILTSLYLIPIIAAWNGYHHLALLWIPNLITTITMVLIIINLNRFLKYIYSQLTNQKTKISRKFYSMLSIPANEKKIFSLTIIRFLMMSVPLLLALMAIKEIWGMPPIDVALMFKSFKNGIEINQVILYPIRMIRAISLFCFVVFLGGVFSNKMIKKTGLSDTNQKYTLKSLIDLLIILVAIGIFLFVSGIDVSKLMFILGGLSLGVGLGLKQFISDAGSGLYLLIEKPIKLGDYILLENIKGTVRKIGTLSTQISTSEHSDVLIPNSSFLSNTLVNYTFLNNRLYRLELIIILNNMLDLDKAQELLLDIARKNPHVIQSPAYQASVHLESNTIRLECEVNGIDQKNAVSSELIVSINERFHEEKITFAFG